MAILASGQTIGHYTVNQLIKANVYTETYKIVDANGNPYFMKLFCLKKLPEKLMNKEHHLVNEIALGSKLQHKNIASYIEYGELETEEAGPCQYYISSFLSGELLVSRVAREGKLPEEEALRIYRNILEGLQYIHNLGLHHNDITPRNIMLPAVGDGIVEIIDWGHISQVCHGRSTFDTADLDVLYCANESYMSLYNPQTDLFSATAVLYFMLTGKAPWEKEYPLEMTYSRKAVLHKEYRKKTPLDIETINVSIKTQAVLIAGLAVSFKERANSVPEILALLDGEADSADIRAHHEQKTSNDNNRQNRNDNHSQREEEEQESPNKVTFEFKKGQGKGFADIAGMQSLKEYLNQRVIFVIKNPALAKEYRITPPNGMLLYGPPGCGKTFVAEKFAEETGFSYVVINASDLGSSYLHGSQEKIAQLFKQAAKHAPVVVCFDEFDALVPDRSGQENQHYASEVNEFLSKLNNCSERGIFIVGTTNRPDKIDPAVLRTGRIDKQVFVPMPDAVARTEMFRLHLAGRPLSEDIDYEKLGQLTENYIASDIAFIVNETSLIAAFTQSPITQTLLEDGIKSVRPSLRPDTLKFYDKLHELMDGSAQTGKSAGYQIRDYGFSFN